MMIKDSLVKWYLTWVFIAYHLNNLVKWYLTRLFERLTKDVAKKNIYKTTSVKSRRLMGGASHAPGSLSPRAPAHQKSVSAAEIFV